jgi:hypothetical protein
MDYIINCFWEVESMEPSATTVRQKACEEHLHTHNPTNKGGVVNKHPTKMESIQPGTSGPSVERRPSTNDCKLGQGIQLKVQDQNFMKGHEEIHHKKSVRFQEGNKTCYSLPQHPVSKEKGSTTRNWIASGGSAKPSSTTQQQ